MDGCTPYHTFKLWLAHVQVHTDVRCANPTVNTGWQGAVAMGGEEATEAEARMVKSREDDEGCSGSAVPHGCMYCTVVRGCEEKVGLF